MPLYCHRKRRATSSPGKVESASCQTVSKADQKVKGQLSCVKDSYIHESVRPEVADFMLGAWRAGTSKNYGCYVEKWVAHHLKENINFVEPSIDVLDYVHDTYKQGLAYSTICMIRWALSTYIKIDGKPVGQHPYVSHLIWSVYQERPNLSKNTVTCSINMVLNYLKSLGPNEELSIEDITKKLLMLMAILSGVRGQTC